MFPSKIRPLLPYAIVVFLGYVGFSLPLPVLPEIFLDAKKIDFTFFNVNPTKNDFTRHCPGSLPQRAAARLSSFGGFLR